MSSAIDQHPQLKYPPRPMTRKGVHLKCLSPEGRNYVDQVVQAELFDDIPETKLDKLHSLLLNNPRAEESDAQRWAGPLELPENRVVEWLKYQRKSAASQSPPPSKYEEVDELNTPKTLVKHELSPEATGSDRSNSRDTDSPPQTDMEMDEDQQTEMEVSHLEVLPTLADNSSTSPNPSDASQTFAQQQKSILSPRSMQVTDSQHGLSTATRAAQPYLEDGEILTEGVHRLAVSSSSPMVGPVATSSRDLAQSFGDRTGNSFPVLTPRTPSSPDVPIASPMRHSSSRGGADRHEPWDDSRHSSRGDSSGQQHPPSRNGPPSQQTGHGKGKAREVFEAVDEARQGPRFVEQRGVGPHRDRPRPLKLYPHPYRVDLPSSSSHRDRQPSSASISYATTPSTSRSMTSPSTVKTSASPPSHGPDGYRIVQAVTMALREMPVRSVRMELDSHGEGATSSTEENVKKILEINSWALGAARSLGVSLAGFPSRGNMPPPPNPLSSPNFRT
ncbi:hypothetical protein FS837_008074 [Tulasnella sp. UAMH 9824]|nr:hypothetical protein FS837_008074 [Tulasnella sp. UAMH 9824]